MESPKATQGMLHRSLAKFQADSSDEAALVEKAQNAGFDDGEFHVGDEVISACGSMSGVILSISGDDALISWACRGKSVEPVEGLAHAPSV